MQPIEKMFRWPQVFIDGDKCYSCKAEAVADALEGWALCTSAELPENFGKGMAHIGAYVGEILTPDNVMAVSKRLRKQDYGR